MRRTGPQVVLLTVVLLCAAGALRAGEPGVEGEMKLYHPVTITFEGPATSETATPNPFTDYRLDVTFRHGEHAVVAPGYYAADGDAANTSAVEGNKWRVHFVPDRVGRWEFQAAFRQGGGVAVAEDPLAGEPTGFDGASGGFEIGPTDKTGADFRGKGLLQYVGQRYLRFSNGQYFIKGGADAPENMLGYYEFDATPPTHQFAPHAGDFRDGDSTWAGGKGRHIIGAMNYLASKGMNSVYLITMNVKGDGKDTWPWVSPNDFTRFDVSKLAQWEVVFSHMDRLGLMIHLLTQETENDQLLDKGDLGPNRRLYYRELVARFGHHLGLIWNLGEENTNTTGQLKAYAEYLDRLDPYDHVIVVHTFGGLNSQRRVYEPLLGYEHLGGASLQDSMPGVVDHVSHWLEGSTRAGRPWAVFYDEQNPVRVGVRSDSKDPAHDNVRKHGLWGVLMAGAAGVEWFMTPDTRLEDWRTRDRMWDQTRYALEFFQQHLPFERMAPGDALAGEGQKCLAAAGDVYAVYLPKGGEGRLDLTGQQGSFEVRWYNPREGGALQEGPVKQVTGGQWVSLGPPPAQVDQDWAVLVRRLK